MEFSLIPNTGRDGKRKQSIAYHVQAEVKGQKDSFVSTLVSKLVRITAQNGFRIASPLLLLLLLLLLTQLELGLGMRVCTICQLWCRATPERECLW